MIEIIKDLPPLGHVGYVVENADSNAAGLSETLGIENFRIYDYVLGRAWTYGKELFPCKLRIAMGSFRNECKIELIQSLADATPHARFLKEKGPGLYHLAFYVKQYDEWLDHFRRAGAQFPFEAEAEEADGR